MQGGLCDHLCRKVGFQTNPQMLSVFLFALRATALSICQWENGILARPGHSPCVLLLAKVFCSVHRRPNPAQCTHRTLLLSEGSLAGSKWLLHRPWFKIVILHMSKGIVCTAIPSIGIYPLGPPTLGETRYSSLSLWNPYFHVNSFLGSRPKCFSFWLSLCQIFVVNKFKEFISNIWGHCLKDQGTLLAMPETRDKRSNPTKYISFLSFQAAFKSTFFPWTIWARTTRWCPRLPHNYSTIALNEELVSWFWHWAMN